MPSKLTITSSIFLAPEKTLNLIFLQHYRILGTAAWQPTVIKRDEKVTFKIQTHTAKINLYLSEKAQWWVPSSTSGPFVRLPCCPGEGEWKLHWRDERRGTRAALPVRSVVVDRLEPRVVGKDLLRYSISGVLCMGVGGLQHYGPRIIHQRRDIVLYFKQNIWSSSSNK